MSRMRLNQTGSNRVVLTLPNRTRVLFSYSTPVAAIVPAQGQFRTEERYSVTTTRHVNEFLDDETEVFTVHQDQIDELLDL